VRHSTCTGIFVRNVTVLERLCLQGTGSKPLEYLLLCTRRAVPCRMPYHANAVLQPAAVTAAKTRASTLCLWEVTNLVVQGVDVHVCVLLFLTLQHSLYLVGRC
jgi:hypothetical protein